jgi:hypothetical protein
MTNIFVSPPASVSMIASAAEKNPPRALTTMHQCEISRCKTFLQTTLLSACITAFLHLYGGVATVLIMQVFMLPMNVWEMPCVRMHVFGQKMDRPYNEKYEGENPNQEEDDNKKAAVKAAAEQKVDEEKKKLDKEMQTVWNAKTEAKFNTLLEASKIPGVNYQKEDDKSTPLMIVAGSPVDTREAMASLLKSGADIRMQDDDGWTPCHWACHHNRPAALKQLFEHDPSKCREIVTTVKDKRGFTPAELAKEQESTEAAEAITAFLETKKKK